jgi:hypothetical protein
MPDDPASDGIKQKPLEDGTKTEAIQTPPPPDNPPTPPAQTIPDQHVEAEVKILGDRVKRAEWLMIGLTAGIVLLTLGLVIVGVLQWRVLSGQLREMHDSGIDTHDLAVAAGKQADRTKDLADRMKDQADETRRIAEATGSYSETSRQQLVGSRAAVVKFTLQLLGPNLIFSGHNIGQTDARNVRAFLAISIRDWPSKSSSNEPIIREIGPELIGNMSRTQDSFTTANSTIEKRFRVLADPSIRNAITAGKQFISIEWSASYDDGFGNIIHTASRKRPACDAWIDLGTVVCEKASIPIAYGPFPCEGVDVAMQEATQRKKQTEEQWCKKPN